MLKVEIDDKTKSDLHQRERLLLHKGDSGGARRIRIIVMSSNGFSVRHISLALSISRQTVRRAIHAFCTTGMDRLSTKPRCGAPPKLTAEVADTIDNIARQAPRNLVSDNPEYESNTWTIRMLKAYLLEYHNLDLSIATVHKALCLRQLRFGRPKHKITSPDVDYSDKRDYINNLAAIIVSPKDRVDKQLKKN